jgi:hypothetical protein
VVIPFPHRAFHVPEVPAILARRNFGGALEDIAHRIDVPKTSIPQTGQSGCSAVETGALA